MAEKDLEAEDIERKVHDLASAMRKVKTAQADRDDVVVEMKHAKVSRLELLAEDLAPVFQALPEEIDMFDFALTQGEVPRLWIDMTSFVRMGKDGRVYEFVKDTRMGRTILGSSKNREKIGARITDYVAERVLERERMLEGDWQSLKNARAVADGEADEKDQSSSINEEIKSSTATELNEKNGTQKGTILGAFGWLLLGLAIGLGALILAMVFDQFEPFRAWIIGLASQ